MGCFYRLKYNPNHKVKPLHNILKALQFKPGILDNIITSNQVRELPGVLVLSYDLELTFYVALFILGLGQEDIVI